MPVGTDLGEQPDTPPWTSVSVAWSVVVASCGTATGIPGEAKLAALPLARAAPVQSGVA